MRSKLIFITMLLLSVSALAFGGGGGGHNVNRVNKRYGMDSIGIHIDPDSPISAPTFGECDDPNAYYNEYGVCICNDGYKKENETCVIDACQGFAPSGCRTECTSSGGQASYIECHGTGTCTNNECDYDEHIDCASECGPCQKCDTSNGTCIIDGEQEGLSCADNFVCQSGSCVCDSAGHWVDDGIGGCKCDTNYKEEAGQCVINACASFDPNANECITDCSSTGGEATYTYATLCHDGAWACNPTSHVCENPCDGKTASGCIKAWNPNAGECVAEYYATTDHHSCDTNKECNGDQCVCIGYLKDSACTACPANATCNGTNFTCNSEFEKIENECLPECGDHEIRNSQNTCVCDNINMWYGEAGNCQLCNATGKIISNNACACDTESYDDIDGTCYAKCNEHEIRNSQNVCVCNNTTMWYGEVGSCQLCSGIGKIINNNSCICDNTGHWVDDGIGGCKCDTNYKEEAGQCVINACASFDPNANECITDCSSTGGEATYTYATLCHDGAWACNPTSHVCENPCDGKTASGCIKAWNTVAGECVEEFQDEGYQCDPNNTNMKCNISHQCVCDGYMNDSVCTACPEHASCDNIDFTCDTEQHFVPNGNACTCDSDNGWYPDENSVCIQCTEPGTAYNPSSKACECDPTQHLDGEPGSCQCASGYHGTATTQCTECTNIHMVCPGGQTFSCQDGYTQSGDDCVCVGNKHIDSSNACVACPEHGVCTDGVITGCTDNYQLEGNQCVQDACTTLRAQYPKCLGQCTSQGGVVTSITYRTTCSSTDDPDANNNWACNTETHACENPCAARDQISDPNEKDRLYPTNTCAPDWSAANGVCARFFAPAETACGNGGTCDGEGNCLCPDGKWYDPPNNNCIEVKTCLANQWFALNFSPYDRPGPRVYNYKNSKCNACVGVTSSDTTLSEEMCEQCVDDQGRQVRFTSRDAFGTPKCNYCSDTRTSAKNIKMRAPIWQIDIDSCNRCANRHFELSSDPDNVESLCACDADKIINGNSCCPVGEKANEAKTACIPDIAQDCEKDYGPGYIYSYDDEACIPCGEADGKRTTEHDCKNSCSDWNMIYDKYGRCHNPPAPGYIVDDAGETYKCDSYIEAFGVLSKEMCDVCKGERFYGKKGGRYYCVRCDYGDAYFVYTVSQSADCTGEYGCPNNRIIEEPSTCKCATTTTTELRPLPKWDKDTQQYLPPVNTNVTICPVSTP